MAKPKEFIAGQIPIDLLSKKKKEIIFCLISQIEQKKTMGEVLQLIDFAKKCNSLKESKKETNVFFAGKIRISFVIDLFVNKIPVRILRTEEIYKDKETPQVNLNTFDPVTASRMLVPSDGLLFKLNGFKNQNEYSDFAISIIANKETLAFEKNTKSGELCIMILCQNHVETQDKEFIHKIESSRNAICGHFKGGGGKFHKISD